MADHRATPESTDGLPAALDLALQVRGRLPDAVHGQDRAYGSRRTQVDGPSGRAVT
jgi:hypothetical protein